MIVTEGCVWLTLRFSIIWILSFFFHWINKFTNVVGSVLSFALRGFGGVYDPADMCRICDLTFWQFLRQHCIPRLRVFPKLGIGIHRHSFASFLTYGSPRVTCWIFPASKSHLFGTILLQFLRKIYINNDRTNSWGLFNPILEVVRHPSKDWTFLPIPLIR